MKNPIYTVALSRTEIQELLISCESSSHHNTDSISARNKLRQCLREPRETTNTKKAANQ